MSSSRTALGPLLESFFFERLIGQRRASPSTVAAYRDALRLLLLFASERIGRPPSRLSVGDLDRDVVLAFLDHLEKVRGNSARTRNTRLAAVRSFFQHVAQIDPTAMGIAQRVLAIPGKRMDKRLIDYLRKEEFDAILAAPDRNTQQGRRDHAVLLFLGRTGARVSEAIAVNVVDLRCDRPWHVRLFGKGRKERVVPLDQRTAAVLRELCNERGIDRHEPKPLFVNARGQRLTRFGVIHILRRAVKVAAQAQPKLRDRSISPHTLRHTVAMHLLQAGVDLVTIQCWLGHAHVDTTHDYVQVDVEIKRQALEKCETNEAVLTRYQPPDDVLAMLESL